MPMVKYVGPYRFYFYSFDCNEPKHIHVQRDNLLGKFWLEPLTLSRNHGFSPKELSVIMRIVAQDKDVFVEAWDEHCG
ncbi:MAG: DUF4160 domain-containing protein [Deltaproteobacteria bacterium]|nr:DUF4160 domain-containing protein [Candidatus Anaeroferrophillacea bacterium]